MFAVEALGAPEVSSNSLLCNGTQELQIRNEARGMTDIKQDKNSNFVVEQYNKNGNFGQLQADGTAFRNSPKLTTELDLQATKEKGDSFTVVGALGLELGRTRSPSAECVRIPPEGAEVGHSSKPTKVRDCQEFAVSPSDDNGYSSSCLSIESPDSVEGSIWETSETVKLDPWQRTTVTEDESVPETPPAADSLLPSILEAVQSLQEKQRFKEHEKEKHQTQVVMYRRLALLRWIRSLQQKVVDHQNRLQESYDTILSNRKELLKFIKKEVI